MYLGLTIRHDTESLTWTEKLCGQLNLAHITKSKKNIKKKKLKQTNTSAMTLFSISRY